MFSDIFGSGKGSSRKHTDIFGDSYTRHYGSNGNYKGKSSKHKGLFGDTYYNHY